MLRPSRPMMRPFMSSDGSSTTVTVVSAVWLAATRWSASAIEIAGAPSRVAAGLFLLLPDLRASSCRIRSSRLLEQVLLRLGDGQAREPSRARASASSFAAFSSSWSCLTCVSRSVRPCSRRWSSSPARSTSCSPRRDPLLDLRQLRARRSWISASTSARSLTASSRASICASRRIVSASRSATWTRSRSAEHEQRRCDAGSEASPIERREHREHAVLPPMGEGRLAAASVRPCGCSHPALGPHGRAPVSAR